MSNKKPNELDILLPEAEVTINGETIEIKPFSFAKLPKVIDLLSKIGVGVYSLFADNGLQFSETGNVVINQSFVEKIAAVTEEHFGEVVELVAIYTGKDAAFYKEDGFDAESGLLLIAAIIERNYDFFTRRLAPTMSQINAKAEKK